MALAARRRAHHRAVALYDVRYHADQQGVEGNIARAGQSGHLQPRAAVGPAPRRAYTARPRRGGRISVGVARVSDIEFERRGPAGVVILNRQQALNAVTHDMVRALRAALEDWARDEAITRIVVTAAP